MEAAEAELLRQHGMADLFGRIPWVHYEADYHHRLWFGQIVRIELTLERMGPTSIRYDFAVSSGDVVAATGKLVVVLAAPDSPRAVPWPSEVRAALQPE